MIDQTVLERVLGASLRTGADFAEVFAEDRRNASARLDDGVVEELSSSRDRGAGVRVVHGTTTGFAHATDLSETGLLAAVEAASAGPVVAATGCARWCSPGSTPVPVPWPSHQKTSPRTTGSSCCVGPTRPPGRSGRRSNR